MAWVQLNSAISNIIILIKQNQTHTKILGQSNSVICLISKLLIFVKLVLKINNKFFKAHHFSRTLFCVCFWDCITWSLFKHIYSPNTMECNRLDYAWLSSVAKLSQNSVKHNLMDRVGLGSICSIDFDWFRIRSHTKFGVIFGSIAKLNRT